MNAEGTIVIEYKNRANAIHELTHAYQHISGAIELEKGTKKGFYVDITDETKAYLRQYFFDPSSVKALPTNPSIPIRSYKDITNKWVYSLVNPVTGDRNYKDRTSNRQDKKGSISYWENFFENFGAKLYNK